MNQDLEKFGEMLRTDPDLQESIAEAAVSHSGTLSTEEAYNLLKPFAEAHGFHATFGEFKEYLDTINRSNDGTLSDNELEQVAGGKSRGLGATECYVVGGGLGASGGDGEGGLCVGIGFGWGNSACCTDGGPISGQ